MNMIVIQMAEDDLRRLILHAATSTANVMREQRDWHFEGDDFKVFVSEIVYRMLEVLGLKPITSSPIDDMRQQLLTFEEMLDEIEARYAEAQNQ